MIKEMLLVHMLNALSELSINEVTWVPTHSDGVLLFHIFYVGCDYQLMVVDGAYSVTPLVVSRFKGAEKTRARISDHIKKHLEGLPIQ